MFLHNCSRNYVFNEVTASIMTIRELHTELTSSSFSSSPFLPLHPPPRRRRRAHNSRQLVPACQTRTCQPTARLEVAAPQTRLLLSTVRKLLLAKPRLCMCLHRCQFYHTSGKCGVCTIDVEERCITNWTHVLLWIFLYF